MVAVKRACRHTTGTLAVQEALQMHGGIGMTDQFDIGLFMKRMRVLQNCSAISTTRANNWR